MLELVAEFMVIAAGSTVFSSDFGLFVPSSFGIVRAFK